MNDDLACAPRFVSITLHHLASSRQDISNFHSTSKTKTLTESKMSAEMIQPDGESQTQGFYTVPLEPKLVDPPLLCNAFKRCKPFTHLSKQTFWLYEAPQRD